MRSTRRRRERRALSRRRAARKMRGARRSDDARDMHVLAFANQKGGCGKTTTAVNLAGALAARGARPLLVDMDPQAHATLALSCAAGTGASLADVLIDGAPLESAIRSAPGDIDLVPATEVLGEFEEVSARRLRPEQTLRESIGGLGRAYDFIVLDCPPRVDGTRIPLRILLHLT